MGYSCSCNNLRKAIYTVIMLVFNDDFSQCGSYNLLFIPTF